MFSSLLTKAQDFINHAEEKTEENGWTILHRAAYSYDADELKEVIDSLGMKARVLAKRFTYDTKQLPIQLIEKNFHSIYQENRLLKLLEPITMDIKLAPLSKQLDEKEIQTQYSDLKHDDPLYCNLSRAYQIINKTRLLINKSSTHTDANSYTPEEKRELRSHIVKMRDDQENTNLFSLSFFNKKTDQLESIVNSVVKSKIGNCYEFSFCACQVSIKMHPTLNSEVYEILNDDHVFLVIGRDPDSKPDDFKTWGTSAVVCDAWGGYAIPACDIPQKLACFYRYHNQNIIVPFDPNYHKLNPIFALTPQERQAYNNTTSFFKTANNDDQSLNNSNSFLRKIFL